MGQVSHLSVLVHRCGPVSLAELAAAAREDIRHVDEFRGVPAESTVQQDVTGRAGEPPLPTNDVRDSHELIVHDTCEVVGRESVRLQDYEVID